MMRYLLLTLLVSSVCAFPREVYKDDSDGYELDENSVEVIIRTGHRLPGMCWACKWAMGKVREHISVGTTKEVVKQLLGQVCDEIGFLRFLCKNIVGKYMGVLIEELSTTDDPATICSHIGIC